MFLFAARLAVLYVLISTVLSKGHCMRVLQLLLKCALSIL